MVCVTVIIVNWNSGALLRGCLDAVSRQTVAPRRILVVDNASSDDSFACVKCSPNIWFSQMPANLGFAAGNNRALAECDTEFVALLNPDAFPEPDWLEHLVAAAHAKLDVAAFGCRQLAHGSRDTLDGIGDSYHLSGWMWRERRGSRQTPRDLVAREIFSPCAAAALYRRAALTSAGGFDEDYFCYVEDVDLGFRLRLAGCKAAYVPDAVVYHVGSATTGGRHSDFAVYHGHRNLVWTFVKNMPGLLFWVLLPSHIVLNVITIVWFTLRGQGKVILLAKWAAVKGVPKMWQKRRAIQKRRVVGIREIWGVLNKRILPFLPGRL
jgi:GT2 family glycosyltransferase